MRHPHFDNFNGGKISRSLKARRIAKAVKAVAHNAHNLVFARRPRATEVLRPGDEFGDLNGTKVNESS